MNKDRITAILTATVDEKSAASGPPEDLLPLVYPELRRLAQRYLGGHRPQTFKATEVVHEAYLRLVDSPRENWRGKSHFFAAAARAMRHFLVDHARRKGRDKRGGDQVQVTFNEIIVPDQACDLNQVLALDSAMKRLARLSERQAQVVELRYFGGLKVDEVADYLGISRRSVEGDWTFAKAWLRRELSSGASE